DAKPELVDNTVVDRDKQDPPKAADDSFGVRPGRATLLDVLSNDMDPDGDVMTVTLAGDQPDDLRVERVLDGRALQAVVPADASGTVRFTYDVTDGFDNHDEGTVTLKVVAPTSNEKPEQT